MGIDPNIQPAANIQHAQEVQAGIIPVGNALLNAGIISLDETNPNEDPSQAVLAKVAQETGHSLEVLLRGDKGFTLDKGFRPDGAAKTTPIPIHTYSNPPGPDCYYFVRHWRVEVRGADGQLKQMHFTKKIYTSVEVPNKLDVTTQKQQQYIAALAASTYAKVEESRIKFGNGQRDVLYDKIEGHISKIANDRFVTLEMFHGQQPTRVAINPLKDKDIKNVKVNQIQMQFRAAKGGVEGEHPPEGYHTIILNPDKVEKSKVNSYQLVTDGGASPLVHDVARILHQENTLRNKQTILSNILQGDMAPEQAFARAGVTADEMKAYQEREIGAKADNFKSQMNFKDAAAVNRLMKNAGNESLSAEMKKKIAPEPSLLRRMRNQQPGELEVLEKLSSFMAKPDRTDKQKEEARLILDAAKNAYNIMKQEHEGILVIEQELVDMDIKDAIDQGIERKAILEEMKGYIDNLEAAGLPAAPVRVQPLALPLVQPQPQLQPQQLRGNPFAGQNLTQNQQRANVNPNPNPFASSIADRNARLANANPPLVNPFVNSMNPVNPFNAARDRDDLGDVITGDDGRVLRMPPPDPRVDTGAQRRVLPIDDSSSESDDAASGSDDEDYEIH